MRQQPPPTPARRPTSVSRVLKFPRFVDPQDESKGVTNDEFRVVFDFSAVATLEDMYDCPLADLGEKFQDVRKLKVRDIQRIIYAGTRTHHPDLTEAEVLNVLNRAVGTGLPLATIIAESFEAFDASAGPDDMGEQPGETTGSPVAP